MLHLAYDHNMPGENWVYYVLHWLQNLNMNFKRQLYMHILRNIYPIHVYGPTPMLMASDERAALVGCNGKFGRLSERAPIYARVSFVL